MIVLRRHPAPAAWVVRTALIAGSGLAAAAALAVVLPMASHRSGTTPADSGGPAVAAPAMEPAAFTLAKQADGSAVVKAGVVYFSVFAVHKGGGYAKAAQFLVPKDAQMNCRTIV